MTATERKLGKRPAVRPHALGDLAEYVKGRIPPPPPEAHWGHGIGFGMLGNDSAGDCVVAAAVHGDQCWAREVGDAYAVPSDRDVLDAYFALTGGPDTGLVESDVLAHWHRQGLLGTRIAAYAPVHPHLVTIRQVVAYYGGCLIGAQVPESAQDQFGAGKPWVVVPGSPIEGGHAMFLSGYDHLYAYAVTWGAIAPLTWPWLATYLDEAWAVIPEPFAEAGRGPALDLESLRADLALV